MSGFTPLSERLARSGRIGAEVLSTAMDRCFTGLIDALRPYGGDVLAFGGDALFVGFFGDGHPRRAADGTVAMMAALRLLPMSTPLGRVRLTMSAGMATGPVEIVVGDGPQRPFFVTGPTVSRAVGLEARARPGETRTDDATADHLDAADRRMLDDGTWLVVRRRPRPPPVHVERYAASLPRSSEPARHLPVALRSLLLSGDAPREHRHVAIGFIHVGDLDRLPGRDRAGTLGRASLIVGDACAAVDVCWVDTDVAVDGARIVISAGVPHQHDDDELRLVAAARRILDSELGPRTSIGVHRGTSFVGAIGHPWRRTYTEMGLTTVTAARLAGIAASGELLASVDIVDRLRDHYAVGPVQELTVKGRRDRVSARRVTALRHRPPTVPGPLVGREGEQKTLASALDAYRAGLGAVVEIVGEAGTGKSHLLGAFLATAPPPRVDVAGVAALGAAPFAALVTPLRTALGIDAARGVTGVVAAAGDRAPLLGTVLGMELTSTDASRAVESASVPAVRAELLSELLRDPAGLMIVEDAHWLDPSSRGLLGAAAPSLAADGWLVVIVRRSDTPMVSNPDITIVLEALGDDDIARLAIDAADAPLSDVRLDAIVRRAGGNALFAVQLARTAPADDVGLPESAERAIGARLDRLRPELRARLRRASVLGTRVELDLLAELTSEPGVGAVDEWRELDEFVACSPTHVEFRHDLIRLAAYAGLTFAERTRLHRAAADALERRPETPPSVLAEHSLHAGRHGEVVHWATRAAEDAAGRAAFADEARLRRLAAESARPAGVGRPERAHLYSALARCYETLAEFDAAERALRTALVLAPPADRTEIRTRLAWISFRKDDLPRARRRVAAALRHLPVARPDAAVLHAELIVLRATIRGFAGDRAGSDRDARSVEREARRLGRDDLLGEALMQLALNADLTDDADTEELIAAAVPRLERTGRIREVAILRLNRGITHMVRGRWRAAVASFDSAAEGFARCGFVLGSTSTDANRGGLLLEMGHPRAAADLLEGAARRARAAGNRRMALFATGGAHRARAWNGETDAAIAGLSHCIAELAARGHRGEADGLDTYLVETLVLAGRFGEARVRARVLLERLADRPSEVVLLTTMRLAAVADHYAGAPGAVDELRRVLDAARHAGAGIEIARCLQALETCSPLVDERWAVERARWCRSLDVTWLPPVTFLDPPVSSG